MVGKATQQIGKASPLLLAAVLWAGTAGAEESRLVGEGFVETIVEQVEVGGVYVVGLIRGDALDEANATEMFVWLPGSAGPNLCVTVRSIDGVYTATDRFVVDGAPAGRHALGFDAREVETIEGYRPRELILDGRLGADCSRPERLTHVPMAWAPDAAADRLVFFINDDGHEGRLFVPLRADGEQVREFGCEELQSDRPSRTFSATCLVDRLGELDLGAGWLEVRRFGQRIAWEDIAVAATASR